MKKQESGRLCTMCGKYFKNGAMKSHVISKHKITMEEYNDRTTTKVDRICRQQKCKCNKNYNSKIDPHQLEQMLGELQEEKVPTTVLIYSSLNELTKAEYNLLKKKAKMVLVIV